MLAVLATFSCVALPCHALRCPDGLVQVGDHAFEVIDACGEPLSRATVVDEPVRVTRIGEVVVRETLGIDGLPATEEWIYEFSPQRFRPLLRFRGNRLVGIDHLDKP